jgi:hypothetical protein
LRLASLKRMDSGFGSGKRSCRRVLHTPISLHQMLLTLALVMNLEVLRERSNQSVLLGLLVLVCESRCVCMGSPCLGKRQGNLKKPDVNKVDTILGYRLSHLIAIVSPSAKAAGRVLGLPVSQRRCVSGGNGRALIIRDLERERETCGEIGRDNNTARQML